MDNKINKPTYEDLAAENALLKSMNDDRRMFIMNGVQLGYIKVPTVETDPALETIRIAISPQEPTPATDVYISQLRNEERAEGVEMAIAVVSDCSDNICPGGEPRAKQYEESIVHPHLDAIHDELTNLASQLREGKSSPQSSAIEFPKNNSSSSGCEGLDEPLETHCHCMGNGAKWIEGSLYTDPPAPAPVTVKLPDVLLSRIKGRSKFLRERGETKTPDLLDLIISKFDSIKQSETEPKNGEVLVMVSGLTGSGKSAIAGEIEIAMKAIGIPVEWVNGDEEKRMTGADWMTAIELYKPKVRIIEINTPRSGIKIAEGE